MIARRIFVAVFIIVALLHLIPVWSSAYLPTADGPSHTYNSWILHQLMTGRSPFLGRYYAVDWRPHPNWLGHALMAAAMTIVPPVIAEKLLFSAILLVFFSGAWLLGGPVYSFLAFPLAYHLLLQMGFYNYSLGVGLSMITLAAWSRERPRSSVLGPRLVLLLLLCYFAHVVAAVVAVVSIFVLWLFGDRKPRQLLALIPVTLLLGWFAMHPVLRAERWSWTGAVMFWPLRKIALLWTFDARQLWLGMGLAALYAILIVVTVVRRREFDPFLLLTVIFVIIYLAAPIGAGEGLILKTRLLIFPFLVVLGFLANARLPRQVEIALVALLAAVSVANVLFIRRAWRSANPEIIAFVRPLEQAAARHTLLPLLFDRKLSRSELPLRSHLVDYVAIDRELVDFDNYEAALGDFPVKFRPEVQRPEIDSIEATPQSVDFDADFVYTWREPPGWRAPERYRLIAQEGEARLYGR